MHRNKHQGCQMPENLMGKPEYCSPEQIRTSHDDTEPHACVETAGCNHPERLKGMPGDCPPARICQCHGDETDHLCECRK